jgi:hypothetical protein
VLCGGAHIGDAPAGIGENDRDIEGGGQESAQALIGPAPQTAHG